MSRISIKRGLVISMIIFGFSALAFGQDDLFGSQNSESGGNFDQSAIDDLFGTFEDPSTKAAADPAVPSRVLPPFTGTYKVLISRPIYAVYEAETKTKWISAMGEMYAYYKIASFPRTYVLSSEQVNDILPNARDYNRRINRQSYFEAARRLGATHVIYQEYQPARDGKSSLYSMELFWLAENATVVKVSQSVIHNAFEGGLDICLAKIADAMDPDAKNSAAFKLPVLGKDQKAIESLGNILADEGRFNRDRAVITYNAADRILQRNPNTIGFQYAAAQLAARAESYPKAIGHINTVISQSGNYPALQLLLAGYLRGDNNFSQALTAAQNASVNPALKTPVAFERAMIYQSQGSLDQARSEYNSIMQDGEADGRVFFRLATLSIQMGRMDEASGYLDRASQSGLSLDEDEYFELGAAYAKVPGHEEEALKYLKRGMGMKQDKEEGWRIIAEIHKRTGNSQLEAESYVNLFKINMAPNKYGLKLAGEIYERIGMVDKAKDAYGLFLDRRFVDTEVSMSLARIYFNEKQCKRLPDVLKGLDTIPEAIQMLNDCGFARRVIDPSQALTQNKISPVKLALRISTLAAAATGVGVGYYFNTQVKSLGDDYENTKSPREADKLRSDIESNKTLRTVFYTVGAAGLAGFTATFFF
ncbi:MAG: hypothetical protein LBI42_04310 [Chitinispirillales bacterium]|jgi:Tfp pilus assembly protein PilF|nr:hypothetical protein [Chitinispirillales bacterium]